jgi:hypothetical protein
VFFELGGRYLVMFLPLSPVAQFTTLLFGGETDLYKIVGFLIMITIRL